LTSTERVYYAQYISDRILTFDEIKFGICDLLFEILIAETKTLTPETVIFFQHVVR